MALSASFGSLPLSAVRRKIHRCAVNNLSSLRCLWSMWPFLSELVALSASSVSPYLGKTPLLGKKKTFIVRKIPMALVGKPIVGKLFRKTHCLFKKTYLEKTHDVIGKTF